MKYYLKFGLLASKNGKVTDKEVFNENGELIGIYAGNLKNGIMDGHGILKYKSGGIADRKILQLF